MKRILISRDMVVPVDELDKLESNKNILFVPTHFTGNVTSGSFTIIRRIVVRSKKTGRDSRELSDIPIEIEGISSLFFYVSTRKKIRNREEVFDFHTGKKLKLVPVARIRIGGNLIYQISEI